MNDKQYMNLVAQMPCIHCGQIPVELHHPRFCEGMSQRASNFLVIPACPECHRYGMDNFHNSGLDEKKSLAKHIEKVLSYLEMKDNNNTF